MSNKLCKEESKEYADKSWTVSFDELSIREYPIILGDNPSVNDGAPLSIGWEHQSEKRIDIDVYEYIHPADQRRHKKDLVIPAHVRTKMLLNAGVGFDEIADATMQAKSVRACRAESFERKGWDRLNIAMEAAGKTLRRFSISKPKQNTIQARSA